MTEPDPVGVPATRPLAVVTGASSGIGLELARQFAQHDFDLVVAAEDAGIDQAASDLRTLGAAVTPAQVDLSTYEGCEQLVSQVAATGRPVEALALNAGVGSGGPFDETDLRLDGARPWPGGRHGVDRPVGVAGHRRRPGAVEPGDEEGAQVLVGHPRGQPDEVVRATVRPPPVVATHSRSSLLRPSPRSSDEGRRAPVPLRRTRWG